MRSDLAKVTTERPRAGGSGKATKYGGRVAIVPNPDHLYEDEVGGFHSSSRHRLSHSKSLTDVLAPLIGNIRKNLGRPWDDVYSEFCQFLDRRSMQGHHIFTHLLQEVKTKGIYEGADGKIYEYRAGVYPNYQYDPKTGKYVKDSKLFGLAVDTPVDGFYVHPRTGLLCDADLPRRHHSPFAYLHKKEVEPIKMIELSHEMQETKGYYGTTMKKVCTEWFARELCGRRPRSRFYGWFYYATKTHTKYHWDRIAGRFAKNAHFEGVEVAPYVSPSEERHYRAQPDKYRKDKDGFWFAMRKEKTVKTTKHSVTRAQMAQIREYLAKHAG